MAGSPSLTAKVRMSASVLGVTVELEQVSRADAAEADGVDGLLGDLGYPGEPCLRLRDPVGIGVDLGGLADTGGRLRAPDRKTSADAS